MEQKGLRLGHFLGLVGAFAALASLWRPWYSVEIPQQFRDLLTDEGAKSSGAVGQVVQGLAAALPDKISASGWQALQGADVAICLGALAAVALVVGAAGAFGSAIRIDPLAAGRGIAAVAAGGLVLAIVHLVHRPLSSDLVHPASGLWIALLGCSVGLVGGLMAMQPEDGRTATSPTAFPRLEPELPELFSPAPAPGSARSSVPPPA